MNLEMTAVEDRLVSTKTIAELFDLNVNHVSDRLTKRKGFPRPIYIGGARRYRLKEVMAYVESQNKQ